MKALLLSILLGLGIAVAAQQPTDLGVASGTILYFDITTATGCPAGWTEHTAARGAYLVALTNGGTKDTLVGSALTDLENRNHTHSLSAHTHTLSAHTHSITGVTGQNDTGNGVTIATANVSVSAGFSATHNVSGTSSGPSADTAGPSTANTSNQSGTGLVPYIEYLVCEKS